MRLGVRVTEAQAGYVILVVLFRTAATRLLESVFFSGRHDQRSLCPGKKVTKGGIPNIHPSFRTHPELHNDAESGRPSSCRSHQDQQIFLASRSPTRNTSNPSPDVVGSYIAISCSQFK